MNRKVFCEKDGIVSTYTDNDVCFEDSQTDLSIYNSIPQSYTLESA